MRHGRPAPGRGRRGGGEAGARRDGERDRDPGSRRETGEADRVRLFGIHAVGAAIANPLRPVHRLSLTDNAEHRLSAALQARGVAGTRVHPRDLDRVLGNDTVHQGALLETEPLPEPTLAEIAAAAATGRPIVVLDQVTDPHNVGAILRSAAVFGAAGLVMTRRNAPEIAGALAKAASGAAELVPVVRVPNLARALEELADLGVRRVGLDGEAEAAIETLALDGAIALVLGSEGRGLRRLTREGCDELCRIGGSAGLASLNVSNAAAVALHMVSLAAGKARKG